MQIESARRPDLSGRWTVEVWQSEDAWGWKALQNGHEVKGGFRNTRGEAIEAGRGYLDHIKKIAARDNPTGWQWAGIIGAGVGVLAGGIALVAMLSKPKPPPPTTPPQTIPQ